MVGVKIYDYEGEYDNLFEHFQNAGINALFASQQLLSKEEFKGRAIKNGIKTFAIFPIFYDPEALDQDSSLYAITQYGKPAQSEWVMFVCPSDQGFRQHKIDEIREFILTQSPDGISLDFIRHFAYWEKIYPDTPLDSIPNSCFDDRCMKLFSQDTGISIPSDLLSQYDHYHWIKDNCFDKWVKWKTTLITKMTREIIQAAKELDPDIMVNLHAVPWRKTDFDGAIMKVTGQDFSELGKYVDFISPMTYSHMVKRNPEWISSVVTDIHETSGSTILPSIQVGISYLSDSLTAEEFEQCLEAAIKTPSSGVIFWNWDALFSDKNKLNIVNRHFGKTGI